MRRDKADIDEEIKHQYSVLDTHIQSRRVFELQMAQLASDIPPKLIHQLNWVNKQIERIEEAIAKLETMSVEDRYSVQEQEYRWALAKAWDNDEGRPSVIDREELEFKRLQLHITIEHSEELKNDILSNLYEQTIRSDRYLEASRVGGYDIVKDYITFNHNGYDMDWVLASKIDPIFFSAFRLQPKRAIRALFTYSDTIFYNGNNLRELLLYLFSSDEAERLILEITSA